jgi:hypothetical protein
MWWGLVRAKTECNAISLHLRWKITYRMIQWLDLGAQLAGWVVHYFAILYMKPMILTKLKLCVIPRYVCYCCMLAHIFMIVPLITCDRFKYCLITLAATLLLLLFV